MEKYNFERQFSEVPEGGVEVKLLQYFEKELINKKEGGIYDLLIQKFRAAGVSDDALIRYDKALEAFSNRPSVISKGAFGAFGAGDKYWAPRLMFEELLVLPDILARSPFKPRLTKGKTIFEQAPNSIDGEKVLELYQNHAVTQDQDKENHSITPFERFLTKLNRYLYFYHESLHIYQGTLIGDQINKLKDDLRAWGVYDPQKETLFIKENDKNIADIEKQEWIDKSIFFLPDESRDIISEYWLVSQDANNEATINWLQEQALQPKLKEQPALVLWLHNSISFQVEGLRTLKKKLQDGEIEKNIARTVFKKLEGSLQYIYDIYFAIADKSEEVASFLSTTDPNIRYLDRAIQGLVVRTVVPM